MTGDLHQPNSDKDWKLRYEGARIPRVVEVPVSTSLCPRLPAPVQVIRDASAEQRKAVSDKKPPYLLLKFENRERPHSTPFADLSNLF